jgi:hypothetical protein
MGLIMKQNMIISIVIVVAICLVVIFFAVGYSRMLQPVVKPVPPTPVETQPVVTQPVVTPLVVTAVPTQAPTPQSDWVSSIQQGTINIDLGKAAVIKGRAKMDPVLGMQGQYPGVITALYSARDNFTAAKGFFTTAKADFSDAALTAPLSQRDSLAKTASTLGSVITSTDLYTQSTQFGLANDWWNSNNIYNQGNRQYEANIQSTNTLLNSMNILTM